MDILSVLLITMFLGTALCIAKVAGQYLVSNQSATEGDTMEYFHRIAARGDVPWFDTSWLEDMYWNIRGTERVFNYTGEGLFKSFGSSCKRAVDTFKQWILSNWTKLLYLGMSIAALGLLVESSELLLGAAGLVGSPNPKDPNNKKERTMNAKRVMDRALGNDRLITKLISALFNTALNYFDSDRMVDIAVKTLKFLPANTKEESVMTPVPGSPDKKEPLVLSKTCVYASSSLRFRTLKYFHVTLPSGNDKESVVQRDHAIMNLIQHLMNNDMVPFGSLKRDSKGRTKFYVLDRKEAEIYSEHTGDFLPYFHKLFTDCETVGKFNVKVVNPAIIKDGKVVKHNDLYDYGVDDFNDGAGICRPCLGDHQFQAIPADGHGKLPIAKGYLDSKIIKDDEVWNDIFGEVDIIIFRGDQIKCFSDEAYDGEWVVGFTWMKGETIAYPYHWELTQFLELNNDVYKVLSKAGKDALAELFDLVSTKEGLKRYISAKIDDAVRSGRTTVIKMKVLAMLYTHASHRFIWVKRQIESMILGDVWRITKSYGITGHGIPLLTNDVLAETDPRYVPFDIAKAVGGDNDGDYIVYMVNKALGMMLYYRFPVVGGPVLRPIPDTLMDALEDHHPEIVELHVNYGLEVPEFSRNDIIKERNTDPLSDAVYTAEDIMCGEEIGTNTNNLKRLLSSLGENTYELCGYTKESLIAEIHKAMKCIESGAIALKYHVDGVSAPVLTQEVYELYPMEYTKLAKLHKPTSWTVVNKLIAGLESGKKEFDSVLYSTILKEATVLFDGFMKDTISTKRMARYIDIRGINISKKAVTEAHDFLKSIGIAMRGVFEKYGNPDDGGTDELLAAELSLVVKAAERYGAKLDLDTLKIAIYKYLRSTKGTGACAVHMAGSRIPEVFGWDAPNASVELPEPKVGAVILTAFRKGSDIPFDKLDLSTANISSESITFKGGVTLSLHKDSIDRVPEGEVTVVNATRYVNKEGKASSRTANLVCKVEATK